VTISPAFSGRRVNLVWITKDFIQQPMPPKATRSGLRDNPVAEDEVLQAVVLADSFNTRFKPLTDLKPRASTDAHYLSSPDPLTLAHFFIFAVLAPYL
jgi:hypothetical protein